MKTGIDADKIISKRWNLTIQIDYDDSGRCWLIMIFTFLSKKGEDLGNQVVSPFTFG